MNNGDAVVINTEQHDIVVGDCEIAKNELATAKTQETLDMAVTKVRALCEDRMLAGYFGLRS